MNSAGLNSNKLKYACLLAAMLLSYSVVSSQDYIITWQGDTLECRMPGKPWKEGLRPARKYSNGHIRLPVFFANDSMRVIEAGTIKGYSRAKHGGSFLCNGVFESKQLVDDKGNESPSWHWDENKDSWYFLQKLEEGAYASLYILYIRCGSGTDVIYCIAKHAGHQPDKAAVMYSRKRTVAFLSDPDVAAGMKSFRYKKNRYAYREIVREYNRLKAEAAYKSK